MQTSAKKWGNSLGIRLPKILANEMKITDGSNLNIKLVDNKIEISLADEVADLDELLSFVTIENKHNEIDTYSPVGRELC